MAELPLLVAARTLTVGKRLPGACYLHKSLVLDLGPPLAPLIFRIAAAAQLQEHKWNVVKLHTDAHKVSFLAYPNFESDAYPALTHSTVVDLERKAIRGLDFSSDPNPPILHRKELMVSRAHPMKDEFEEITREGEAAGLYESKRRIGFLRDWERVIQAHGYVLVDNRLFRRSSISDQSETEVYVHRERTAISRATLSAPMRLLSSYGFVEGTYSICDYGCGRGDDLRVLASLGVDAIGWDPNHYPEGDRLISDVVNLGFVINVIEDREERDDALIQAYALASRLLVVSAMVAGDAHILRFRPYKDGVLTSRNTFQKYYSQGELKTYIEQVLGATAMPIASGIFFVFRDELLEAQMVLGRTPKPRTAGRTREARTSFRNAEEVIAGHSELFDCYWEKALELGRWPAAGEFSKADEVAACFGTIRKAQLAVSQAYQMRELEEAERRRRNELTFSQAMAFFRGREPFRALPEQVQIDVRSFYGTYRALQKSAKELLGSLVDTSQIERACVGYWDSAGVGHLEEAKALTVPCSVISELPVSLRAYIGCGEQLAGRSDQFDLVKIHFHTGKVSFLRYEGFLASPLPLLVERVKVDLWKQRVSYYDYVDEFKPKPLYWKSKFLPHDDSSRGKQASFDKRLDELGLAPDNPHFGFPAEELAEILSYKGLQIRGSRFFRLPLKK